MPHEFLNEKYFRILFISTHCTAIVGLARLHPLCHLFPPVCLLLVSIKYLLLLYSLKSPAFYLAAIPLDFRFFPTHRWRKYISPSQMICLPKSVFGCVFENTIKSISSLAFPQFPQCPVCLMPLCQSWPPLHLACWSILWKRAGEVAEEGRSAQWAGGVWEVAAGEVLTSDQQRWW